MSYDTWVITAAERMRHNSQFQLLNPVSGFITGDQARGFFLQSGLSTPVLGEIWSLADTNAQGKLNQKEFSIAMFLIKKCLEGAQLPSVLPSGLRSDPKLIPIAQSMTVPGDQTPAIPSGDTQPWVIPSSLRNNYQLSFNQHKNLIGNFVTGSVARNLFLQSGLPQSTLACIWTLSDMDGDGNLTFDEFATASFLVEKVKAGARLPSTIPATLLKSLRQESIESQKFTDGESFDDPQNEPSKRSSFEDERQKNFRQGQAELERRKQELIAAARQDEELRLERERQKRVQEETLRKEKEALEAVREAQRLRDLAAQRDVRRRQSVEARTKAWREAELKRLQEAEKQRVEALSKERNQLQALLEQGLAHRASLIESASLQEQRRRELDSRLTAVQSEVDAHKSEIMEMRSKRDAYERDIRELTEKVEAAKAELAGFQRESEQLNLRISNGVNANAIAEQHKTLQENQTLRSQSIQQLRDQLTQLDSGMTQQGQELASRRNRVDELNQRTDSLRTEVNDLRQTLLTYYPSSRTTANEQQDLSAFTDGSSADKEVYEVMFDFTARHPDELSLLPGTQINVHTKPPVTVGSGWLYGECDGKKGLFPEAYVRKKVVDKIDPFDPFGVHKPFGSCDNQNPTPSSAFDAAFTKEFAFDASSNVSHLPTPKPDFSAPSLDTDFTVPTILFSCRALFAYHSTTTGDLCFEPGDVIQVYQIKDDWWLGTCDRTGEKGLFPSNYTEKLPSQSPPVVETIKSPESSSPFLQPTFATRPAPPTPTNLDKSNPVISKLGRSGSGSGPPAYDASNGLLALTKPEFARVYAPYKAASSSELSLTRGQVVQVRKRSDTGWWEGEIQNRGCVRQRGWFPANYVRVITSVDNALRSHSSSPIPAEHSVSPSSSMPTVFDEKSKGLKAPSVHSPHSLGHKSPVIPASNVTSGAFTVDPSVELMKALYSYKAVHADELTFNEGDIITVLGRDEPEWWRGRVRSSDAVGLFPVNYVRPYQDSESGEKQNGDDVPTPKKRNLVKLIKK